ncbi:MAG: dTDP-4-dehydrorhamnose reductase [Balneolales bacterium]
MKGCVLLLGSGGQLGSEWSRYLKGNGIKFKSCTSSVADITDGTALRSLFNSYRPDVVINCAAYTDVDLAEEEPEEAREVNADAVGDLARLCQDARAKLIHYSTDYVFPGHAEDRERLPLGYPETYTPNPVNTYGLTKLMGEQLVARHCSDYMIIRTSWLCGLFGNNFVRTMLALGRDKKELRVVSDQFGAPTFTGNLVKNSLALLEMDYKGIIHASSSGLTTWHEMAETIFSKENMNINVTAIPAAEYPSKAPRPFYSRLDLSNLSSVSGTEVIPWQEGLYDLLRQIKSFYP